MKSNTTKWFEREIEKTKQQLKDCEPYQNLLRLQSALEFSKKLDERKEQQ